MRAGLRVYRDCWLRLQPFEQAACLFGSTCDEHLSLPFRGSAVSIFRAIELLE
jgi:hypothetical protein